MSVSGSVAFATISCCAMVAISSECALDAMRARVLAHSRRSSIRSLVSRGQVDKEDLVEAAFAQQFRRERGDIIRSSDDERRSLLVLHPGQEGAEDAAGRTAVRHSRTLGARETFFQFVQPQNTGRD